MWTKIALGLIGFLGLLILVVAATGHISVAVEPLPESEQPNPAWLWGWLFILFSAVIIVGVTAVRFTVRAIGFLRSKRTAPPSGPWS